MAANMRHAASDALVAAVPISDRVRISLCHHPCADYCVYCQRAVQIKTPLIAGYLASGHTMQSPSGLHQLGCRRDDQ